MFRLTVGNNSLILNRGFLSRIRFQSSKVDFTKIEDPKLRQIIESSSFGNQKDIKNPSKPLETSEKSTPKESKPVNNVKTSDLKALSEKLSNQMKQSVDKLPSQKEELRNKMSKRFDLYMESLQHNVFKATRLLNDVTGYSSIEQLRNTIETLEKDLKEAKNHVKQAKDEYTSAIQERSYLQKEVNELLTRKHNWTPEDLERFTELYRNDHVNEKNESSAQDKLETAEQLADSIQQKLTQLILSRYHEEQIWSDKIRRASTWGTWGLMGFNVVLFAAAAFIVEPWKRKRMVEAFDDKVRSAILQLSDEQGGKFDSLMAQNRQSDPTTQTQKIGFKWDNFKRSLLSNYETLISPNVTTLEFSKMDFGILVSCISIISCTLASLLTIYLH